MTCTINHFGHFYLTYLLFDSIKKSKEARVLNLSSFVHYDAKDNFLEDMNCENSSYGSLGQYFISKMLNVIFTLGLHNLLK